MCVCVCVCVCVLASVHWWLSGLHTVLRMLTVDNRRGWVRVWAKLCTCLIG